VRCIKFYIDLIDFKWIITHRIEADAGSESTMSKKENLAGRYAPQSHEATATVLPMRGLCPCPNEFTDYDRRNMALYTWLLIASEDGAGIEELASEVLQFDLTRDRDWAIRVTLSHIERARWVQDQLVPTLG
jgi:hypothetical protein